MGCDIHLFIEARDMTTGLWQRAEELVPNRWFGKWEDEPELTREQWYHNRNYSLFAMLANVRNGEGFAGTDIGKPVVPISEPRGLPEDVSDEVQKESDGWGVDGHSHSWFTAHELLSVDWNQSITHHAWVRKQRKLLPHREGVDDDSYAEQWQNVANALEKAPDAAGWGYEMCGWSSEGLGASGWRQVAWTERWSTAVGSDWLLCLLRMYRAAPLGDPTQIRAVFWFDN
jgi:hypothetical protein